MSLEKKCPVCGHVGATAVSVYSDMMRCGFCGLTDSGHMFKDVTNDKYKSSPLPGPIVLVDEPDAYPDPHPNLSRAGVTGVVVGPDITREDVERLASAFGCTLVEKSTIDLDRLAYAALARAATESKWIPASYMANDWLADACEFLRNGYADLMRRIQFGFDTLEVPDMSPMKTELWKAGARAAVTAASRAINGKDPK